MTDQKPDRQDGDGLEYALGALRTIAASAHDTSAKQMAAIAQAGIDLATKGPGESASERGDGPTRDGAEGAGPTYDEKVEMLRLADDIAGAEIADFDTAQAQIITRALRIAGKLEVAPPKPAPSPFVQKLNEVVADANAGVTPKPAPYAMRSIPVDAETRRDLNVIFRSAINRRAISPDTLDDIIGDAVDEVFKLAAPVPPADGARHALEHAEVRFACLADHFREHGEDALQAMAEVDRDRMVKGLAALSPPCAGAAEPETEQQIEDRLMKQDARDMLRLIDHIADKIGLPHDEELSRDNFNAWLVSLAGAAEPVAWRAFCSKTGGQMINPLATKDLLIEQADHLYAEHGYILQPLYAATPVKGDREAIARVICCRDGCVCESVGETCIALDESCNYAKTADAILSLPVQPGAGERDTALIERCAKIAEPWPGFWLDEKSTDVDRAVVAVRTEIAKKIRAVRP